MKPNITSRLPLVLVILLTCAASNALADTFLPNIGGDGGSEFIARCPEAQNLTGFELRAGDDIDAIRPVCAVSTGPKEIGAQAPATGWYGGPGGANVSLLCPSHTPIVLGVDVYSEGLETITVNTIWLFCGQAVVAQTAAHDPSAVFDAPHAHAKEGHALLLGTDARMLGFDSGTQRCPAGQVAIGLHGRYGVWLDAMGLICAAPHLSGPNGPTKSLGRVEPLSTPGPTRPICDVAKEARARNSPAAAGLEAQCRAHLEVLRAPVAPVASAQPTSDRAYLPTLPSSAGVDAQTLDSLAARGRAIANANPLLATLRNREANGPARRGFDIGIAAAEGNTEPGPGKQRIHDALAASEQGGYDLAVAFSLERNRNIDFANKGAAIARTDRVVAQARTADPDVFFWLGFDIATGLFGDPKLGAQGNTVMGPGSAAIRNALSAAGQRGFNAAVTLHLGRRYR